MSEIAHTIITYVQSKQPNDLRTLLIWLQLVVFGRD